MEDVDNIKQPTPKSGPVLSKDVEMMEGIPEEIAESLKNEGNEAFKVNNLLLAITKYSQSLGTCVSLLKIQSLSRVKGFTRTVLHPSSSRKSKFTSSNLLGSNISVIN